MTFKSVHKNLFLVRCSARNSTTLFTLLSGDMLHWLGYEQLHILDAHVTLKYDLSKWIEKNYLFCEELNLNTFFEIYCFLHVAACETKRERAYARNWKIFFSFLPAAALPSPQASAVSWTCDKNCPRCLLLFDEFFLFSVFYSSTMKIGGNGNSLF